VHVAVGQHQAAPADGVVGGEDLGYADPGVVGDQVDAVDAERVQETDEGGGLVVEGDALAGGGDRLAVAQEIHREIAADVGEHFQLVSPEVPVDDDAVHVQRDRRVGVAGLAVGHTAGGRVDVG
jgi:hypothetical protein